MRQVLPHVHCQFLEVKLILRMRRFFCWNEVRILCHFRLDSQNLRQVSPNNHLQFLQQSWIDCPCLKDFFCYKNEDRYFLVYFYSIVRIWDKFHQLGILNRIEEHKLIGTIWSLSWKLKKKKRNQFETSLTKWAFWSCRRKLSSLSLERWRKSFQSGN